MNKKQLINAIVIIIMVACLLTAMMFYYQRNVQECTSNPLVFAAELYETNYMVTAIGTMTLIPTEPTAEAKVIDFNSNRTAVRK